MRYYVMSSTDGKWYGIYFIECDDIRTKTYVYGKYDTEQEAIEKCAKLNEMLYPQPYIFIDR